MKLKCRYYGDMREAVEVIRIELCNHQANCMGIELCAKDVDKEVLMLE